MSEYNQAAQILKLAPESAFDSVGITLASPETIRSWSKGEVKNPETINYRTFKPEKGGLFCERIFGPQKDWECSCGKYKRIKHKGVTCDRCGVEVCQARVRRERMGHIELAVPVSHIWFFKCTPSRMALVLDIPMRQLERVLYYEDYIVIDAGETPLKAKQLLSEEQFREMQDKFGDKFTAKMGAEGVRELMKAMDLTKEMAAIKEDMANTRSKQTRKKLTKRMKLLEGFNSSGTRPEWMVLEVLPVIPPDLRPLVPLEGGRFATSDLNDLYRRVINRNNRLRNLLQLKTPDVIIRNEKRMLQEAVDALFDNGRHGRAVTGTANRPLKSLSDMLRGKQGRFRQNLLGKRVDYSGRSVIVVGPELGMHQCGLPKKMALALFEPFIIRRLKEMGVVHTVRSAKKLIEREDEQVWDILEEVTRGHTVMLNRAPTLHRLSIQSFEPVLIEGEAIRIHPLVCTAYNADFDGDQMAVHVPLSIEAQMESRLLMLAPNNIFSPSSGKPITTPTQDIALGCYYLTSDSQRERIEQRRVKDAKTAKAESTEHLPLFGDRDEVHTAFDDGAVHLHQRIRIRNPDFGKDSAFGRKEGRVIATTVGRVFFNEIWPVGMGFINRVVKKKDLGECIRKCYEVAGHAETVRTLDRLKTLGFEHATRAGISIGIVDMIIPSRKKDILEAARTRVQEVSAQYRRGIITDGERYNQVVDIWTHATDALSGEVQQALEYNNFSDREGGDGVINPVFMMVDSGARGSRQQIRQLSGMRGLMAKPSGEIIERPILSNFREGLSVLEYFISTHGARKGLADTALKTADAGYLTRRLVDVAHDIIISEVDCGTLNHIEVEGIFEGEDEIVSLATRIIGRTAVDDITTRTREGKDETIVMANQGIDEYAAQAIVKAGIEKVRIRSVLTCESVRGVCAKCYGRNLGSNRSVAFGEAVGIIAAQSIGEPGTQLTMRTFHIGGTASQVFKQPQTIAKHDGILRYIDLRTAETKEGSSIVLNKNGEVAIYDEAGHELERHSPVLGAVLAVPDGKPVKKGQVFLRWDPYNVPVLTDRAGTVKCMDFITDVTVRRERNEQTGKMETIVIEHREDHNPQVAISYEEETWDEKSQRMVKTAKTDFYSIPAGAHVTVNDGDKVAAGDSIAKTPRKQSKTKDITGGLPRVAELFEARKPKDASEISRIDGIVSLEGTAKGKRKLVVTDPLSSEKEEHLIPIGKHIVVQNGDRVRRGQQLTEGPVVPQEILEVCGKKELQAYLLNEIQEVYRLQGVEINDKHIEVIVRQMLRKVRVTEPNGTDFLWGEQVERYYLEEVNRQAQSDGKQVAVFQEVLLGITKAALETESFISAASFQDTTRVLADAATLGRKDYLRGFKENVIMGHLIPAGTGFPLYTGIKLVPMGEPIAVEALYGDRLGGAGEEPVVASTEADE